MAIVLDVVSCKSRAVFCTSDIRPFTYSSSSKVSISARASRTLSRMMDVRSGHGTRSSSSSRRYRTVARA